MLFREREAILMRMNEIQLERERLRLERIELRDEYQTHLDRLRELDREESASLDANGVVGELSKAVEAIASLIPKVSVEDILEKIPTEHLHKIEEPEPERKVVESFDVSEQNLRDVERQTGIKQRKKPAPRTTTFNKKRATAYLKKVLDKDEFFVQRGETFKTREIVEYLKDKLNFESMSAQSTNVMMWDFMTRGYFERLSNGVYLYKEPSQQSHTNETTSTEE